MKAVTCYFCNKYDTLWATPKECRICEDSHDESVPVWGGNQGITGGQMIQINENWRIWSDQFNVIIEHRREGKKKCEDGKPKYTWKKAGYFRTFQQALDYLVDLDVMGDGMKDLESINKKMDSIHQDIKNIWVVLDKEGKNEN